MEPKIVGKDFMYDNSLTNLEIVRKLLVNKPKHFMVDPLCDSALEKKLLLNGVLSYCESIEAYEHCAIIRDIIKKYQQDEEA